MKTISKRVPKAESRENTDRKNRKNNEIEIDREVMNSVIRGRVNEDNIPHLLKKYPNWVVWKGRKVPLDPKTGKWASVKDPDTWTDFKTAYRAYLKLRCDGIGFVLTPQLELCGADLDHCRDPRTGEIEAWALKTVTMMRSYTEISPSGTGLHTIAQGTLPLNRMKGERAEIFCQAGYLTVTGWHLKTTPQEVRKRQDALWDLYAEVRGVPGMRPLFPEW